MLFIWIRREGEKKLNILNRQNKLIFPRLEMHGMVFTYNMNERNSSLSSIVHTYSLFIHNPLLTGKPLRYHFTWNRSSICHNLCHWIHSPFRHLCSAYNLATICASLWYTWWRKGIRRGYGKVHSRGYIMVHRRHKWKIYKKIKFIKYFASFKLFIFVNNSETQHSQSPYMILLFYKIFIWNVLICCTDFRSLVFPIFFSSFSHFHLITTYTEF